MDLMMTAIPAAHVGGAGLGAVDQVLTLPDLVDLFLEGNNPELAKAADQFESLHIQGPEAGVVEPLGHHPNESHINTWFIRWQDKRSVEDS